MYYIIHHYFATQGTKYYDSYSYTTLSNNCCIASNKMTYEEKWKEANVANRILLYTKTKQEQELIQL